MIFFIFLIFIMKYYYLENGKGDMDANKIKHFTSVIGPNPIKRQFKDPKKKKIEDIFIKSKSKK